MGITVLDSLTALLMLVLIIFGGIYIITYDRAKIWERIHIFAVGFGMYCGIIGLYWQ